LAADRLLVRIGCSIFWSPDEVSVSGLLGAATTRLGRLAVAATGRKEQFKIA
jgi:hypothetical protein